MLRTRLKASTITNLTDARYFAAWDVTWMGFCLDPHAEDYLPPRTVEAIRGWIDGPRFVGEFNLQDAAEITEAAAALRLDAIQAGPHTPAGVLRELKTPLPVIKEIPVEPDSTEAALADTLDTFAPLAGTFLLNAERAGLSWNDLAAGRPIGADFLADLCQTYPIILALDLTPEALPELLDRVRPHGLSLHGGAEEKVGFKSFDELDLLLEALSA